MPARDFKSPASYCCCLTQHHNTCKPRGDGIAAAVRPNEAIKGAQVLMHKEHKFYSVADRNLDSAADRNPILLLNGIANLCRLLADWPSVTAKCEMNSIEIWNEFNWNMKWIQLKYEMTSIEIWNEFNWNIKWIQLKYEMNSIEISSE